LLQVSELLPVQGIDYAGPLPAEIQKITMFSAAVAANAKKPTAATAHIQYLASPQAYATIKKAGLELGGPKFSSPPAGSICR
jgi:molybdate transport system substrate-binding protein